MIAFTGTLNKILSKMRYLVPLKINISLYPGCCCSSVGKSDTLPQLLLQHLLHLRQLTVIVWLLTMTAILCLYLVTRLSVQQEMSTSCILYDKYTLKQIYIDTYIH